MRSNKILVILMAILLLAATLASAMAAGTYYADTEADDEPPVVEEVQLPEIPEVTVAGVNVSGTEFFELSLRVSARRFQTVGVVLSYDTDVLTPILWTADENGDPQEAPLSGDSWSNPNVLPTKGADGLAGKPSLAYAGHDEEGNKTNRAYLYLGADALAYTDLRQEQVVTVRFQKSAQTVTMPVAEGADLTDEAFTVCLAPEDVAEDAIPGTRLLTTTAGGPDGSLKAYAYGDEVAAEGETVLYAPSFTLSEGSGINTGGGGSGDYAITFFDWDGRVIDAIAAPRDAAQAVADWQGQKRIQERLTNKPGYAFDQWLIVEQVGGSLETDGGTFTSNDTPLDESNSDVASAQFLAALPETTIVTDGTEETSHSVLLQAAYVAKTKANGDTEDLVNGGSEDNLDMYYTISEPIFTRYGSADAVAGSYSLTMTVTRKNGDNGVTRLREPAIWVAMTPSGGGANIMNLITLENTDETTFEIVTTKQVSEVSYKVIDIYGISNWPGCANKSLTTVQSGRVCLVNGTRGYLAEQAYAVAVDGASWDATVNNWAFADACLRADPNSSGTGADDRNAYTWWTDARCTAAKTALENKTRTENRQLTYDEVLTVLKGVS